MLEEVINSLKSNLKSLREFVDLVDSFLKEKEKEVYEKRSRDLIPLAAGVRKLKSIEPDSEVEFTDEHLENMQEEFGGEFEIQIPDEDELSFAFKILSEQHEERFDGAIQELRKSSERSRLLYYSALMNLTSIVEWYFSQILHFYFDKYPDAVGNKDKVFSYEDLKGFKSIDDARNFYKQNKIEQILRDSFKEWLNFFRKSSLNLSMSYVNDYEEMLYETFLRRNLVVHNAGRVNSTYLQEVSKAYAEKVKSGEKLQVTREYLDERIDIFEKNCVLIALELWKKLDQNDSERATFLDNLNYYYLQEKRFKVAKSTSYFLMNDKNMSEEYILSGQLNYWLSQKRLGNWEEIEEEVKSANFNAKGKLFQLGYHSLCEESDKFFELFPRALKSEDIDIEMAEDFPILEEMRKDKRFNQIIENYQSQS